MRFAPNAASDRSGVTGAVDPKRWRAAAWRSRTFIATKAVGSILNREGGEPPQPDDENRRLYWGKIGGEIGGRSGRSGRSGTAPEPRGADGSDGGSDGDSHRVLLSTFAESPAAAASRELPTQRPNRLPTRHFGPKTPPPPEPQIIPTQSRINCKYSPFVLNRLAHRPPRNPKIDLLS